MPTSRAKFGRDVVIAGLAAALKSTRNLLMLPLLTHSLSLAEYGIWEQIMAGVALLLPWVSLQLSGALMQFLPGQSDRAQAQETFYSAFSLAAGFSLFCGLLLWLCAPLLEPYPYFALFMANASPVAALIPLSVMVGMVVSYFRASRLMVRHSLLTLVQNFGEIGLIASVLVSGEGLREALVSLAAARGLLLAFGGTMLILHLGWRWPHFRQLRAYLAFSIPQIPHSSFYRIFDLADRYILNYWLGPAAVGLYSIAYTSAGFFITVLYPIHLVLLPALAELWNTRQLGEMGAYATHALRYSCLIGFPCLAGLCAFPLPILDLLVPRSYAGAALYLPALAAGFLLYGIAIPAEHVVLISGRTKLLLLLNGILAGANVLCNLVLVPLIGLWGAVLATLIGQIYYAVAVLVFARRALPFRLPWKEALRYGACALVMALLLVRLNAFVPVPILLLVLAGGALYLALLLLSRSISPAEIRYFAGLMTGRGYGRAG
ncbi:MAG: polysaccharide biosynthesis C-terminal domain-containing protein [Candidatus Handelsmanbacteria bacterium]|nr:polysaccharide biosynthesis C-terminal domain-containing protein [Candidatus Handelsmanbacteria bacterium]